MIIGAAHLLPALKERIKDHGEVVAYAEAEALRALDAINARRPSVVALERRFAATSRGAALINRIKADPSLDACEIRVIAHDSDYVRISRRPNGNGAPPPAAVASPQAAVQPRAVAVEVAPPTPAAEPIDFRGTRRAPRFKMQDRVEVLVDGNPATLIDLSVVGAQVLSPTVLRPNQRVRIALPDNNGMVRFNASVAWASFELPRANPTPHYRAGVDFADANASAVGAFCARHKRDR